MQLIQGDCLELMKQIPDHSVDMVLCDLPYGVLGLTWDERIDGKRLFSEYKRVCKQNSNVLLFCQIEFAKYLMESTFASEFSHCLVWVKNNKTRSKSAKRLPLSQYEMILCFRLNKYSNKQSHKGLRDYFMGELDKSGFTVPQLEKLIPNYSAHHWFRYSSDYRIPTEENYKRLQEITGYFTKPYEEIKQEFFSEKHNLCTFNPGFLESDVLYGTLEEPRVHPTQKPVSLLEKLIKAYSNPGETVLDNTMGSGSTGVACVNTGRNFIGIELNQNYFQIAEARICGTNAESADPSSHECDVLQMSMFELSQNTRIVTENFQNALESF